MHSTENPTYYTLKVKNSIHFIIIFHKLGTRVFYIFKENYMNIKMNNSLSIPLFFLVVNACIKNVPTYFLNIVATKKITTKK